MGLGVSAEGRPQQGVEDSSLQKRWPLGRSKARALGPTLEGRRAPPPPARAPSRGRRLSEATTAASVRRLRAAAAAPLRAPPAPIGRPRLPGPLSVPS